jgi:hypothetical protein
MRKLLALCFALSGCFSDFTITDTPDAAIDVSLPDTGATAEASVDAGLADADADATVADAPVDARDAGPPVVIHFDDLANGTLTAGYKGLRWDADWYVFNTIAGEYNARSGTQFITNNAQKPTISVEFPSPVFFVGAWFSLRDNRNASVRFDVFDAAGALIKSSATLEQTLTPTLLEVNAANVSKVTVWFDDDFAMDDLTYVP